jgi:ATP-dependent Lon protease
MLGPLLDRIEIIHVPAYLPIEKIAIAEKYLIPRLE